MLKYIKIGRQWPKLIKFVLEEAERVPWNVYGFKIYSKDAWSFCANNCIGKLFIDHVIWPHKSHKVNRRNLRSVSVRPDWAIYWTLGNFQSLLQQLICPNLLHSQAIFVKMSKSLIFQVKSFLGNFYSHMAIFYWSHCQWYVLYSWGHQRVHKVTTSIGSKQELIEKFLWHLYNKVQIRHLCISMPVKPIDVDTLLMRGRPQATTSRGNPCFIYLIYRNLCIWQAN